MIRVSVEVFFHVLETMQEYIDFLWILHVEKQEVIHKSKSPKSKVVL